MSHRRLRHLFRTTGTGNILLKPKRLLYPTLLFVLLLGLYQLFFGPYFRIKTISCTLDSKPCENNLKTQIESLKGTKTIALQTKSLKQRLLQISPEIEDIQFKVIFPDLLTVNLFTSRNLILLQLIRSTPPPISSPSSATSAAETAEDEIATSSSTHRTLIELKSVNDPIFDHFYLTSKGSLIQSSSTLDTDRIIKLLVENDLPSPDSLENLYQLYQELTESNIDTKVVWATNTTATLFLNKTTLVVFSLNKDPRQSVASLQQILHESTINPDQSIIDLRFSNPVISKINNLENSGNSN